MDRVDQYSPATGFVYVFNLIVGTGALTLPAAFHDAGWAMSTLVIVMLAFMSYLTATFMIEAMAAANAMVHHKRLQRLKRSGGSVASDSLIERTMQIQQSEQQQSQQQQNISRSSSVASTPRRNISNPDLPSTSTGVTTTSPTAAGRETPSNFHYVNRDSSDDEEDEREANAANSNSGESEPLIAYAARADSEMIQRVPRNVSAYYSITEVIEMGRMASMFFNGTGRTLFYLCITIYLYGDLAIYGAAVAKSLRDVACTHSWSNMTPSVNMSDSEPCWKGEELTRLDAYRICLCLFTCIVGPFAFCDVQKTKYLQIFTTIMRWLAFGFMVALATARLAKGIIVHPPVMNLDGLPNLFGVCVYSFMCHHSLPSLVTPISQKRRISWLLLCDYMVILGFYFLLAFTGIFTFSEINDLYTLNFSPKQGEELWLAAIHYFLSLFPVFTLSTNFPIIAITLRNNLKALFLTEGRMYSWCTRGCIFPLLALLPPVAVAFVTSNLELLVGITGSYAGAGIQYIVPALLVYFSRRTTREAIGVGVNNQHSSYFRSTFWVVFVNIWAVGSVALVTWNHIQNKA